MSVLYVSNRYIVSIENVSTDIINLITRVFSGKNTKQELQWVLEKASDHKKTLNYVIRHSDRTLVAVYVICTETIAEHYDRWYGNKRYMVDLLDKPLWESLCLKHNAAHGVALAVQPELKGAGFGRLIRNYVYNDGWDYVWGIQERRLENIDFWLKHRQVVFRNMYCYTTVYLSGSSLQ